MKPLTSVLCLTVCLLAFAVGASAQEKLNFSDLPLISNPSPMPNGYGRLDWGNFFYVSPYSWSGSGAGYKLGPQGEDVAFVGGLYCRLSGYACFGTLSDSLGFELVSADVAGGYGPTQITITAYNNGKFLGSQQYFLGTQMRTLTFPASWGVATQVMFEVTGQPGSLVVYNLNVFTLGG
ncbi:MAG: hypothetical protein WA655_01575 [Candidatus Korobacteraceae bacterium]